MCLGSTPKAPLPPPALPEAPQMPNTGSANTQADADRRRRASAGGDSGRSTILTTSRGTTTSGSTATKTLLGQ